MTPEQAATAIGEASRDDYILAPLKHADDLPPSAQALTNILRSAPIRILAEQFERYDTEANIAQHSYKSTFGRANSAVMMATVLGALMMAAEIIASAYQEHRAVLHGVGVAAGILGGLVAALGSMWLFRVREGRLVERWLNCRAKAETARGGYFAALVDVSDDPPLRLLKFEYFRRYQLELQRSYLARASERYTGAAQRTLKIGTYAVGLSSLSAFLGGALGISHGSLMALGALSVIGGALGAYAGAREAMSQNRRNAERCENALESIELLAAKLDEVRAAIHAGSADALKVFVSAVNEQVMVQHKQWLEAAQGAKSAIDAVETALTKFEKGAAPKTG